MTKQVQRRRGTATQHTSFTGAEGELSVNTTNKSVHVHDGSTAGGIELARKDGSNVAFTSGTLDGVTIGGTTAGAGTFTNLTATGTTTLAGASTSANITFGDNDKAIFGAGSDLQIYHDGSHSYITDSGTGNLRIRGTDITLQDASGNGYISMVDGGAGGTVYLKHLGSNVLTTTSTGIDVTGTVTADGLTVNKGSDSSDIVALTGASAGRYLKIQSFTNSGSAGAGYDLNATSGQGAIRLSTANNARLKVEDNGDISFYEDTGTTAKFFWDASTESLGIGTSSPSSYWANADDLVVATSGNTGISVVSGTTSLGYLIFADSTAGGDNTRGGLGYDHSTNNMLFRVNNDTKMTIDSSGNVGIGTSSPQSGLHVVKGTADVFRLERDATNDWRFQLTGGALAFRDATNDAERMRIDSSGRVGIGTSSPAIALHVNSGATNEAARFESTDTEVTLELKDITGTAKIKSRADFRFETGATPSEAMRIDSSGNLLVGKTTTSTATVGAALYSYGAGNFTRSGAQALDLNRTTSDGDIILFRKDNAAVGSIGSRAGTVIYITSTGTGETGLDFGGTSINPMLSGSLSNGTTDLGNTGNRFKDLHLSGNVNAGGQVVSSSSFKLDTNVSTPTGNTMFRPASNTLAFGTNSAERMRIDSSGRVGIGTTSPQYTLNVGGDIVADGDNNTRTIGFDFYGALKYNLHVDGTTDADKMFIRRGTTNVVTFDASNNVGIGTSPASGVNLHLHEAGSGQMLMAFTNDTTGSGSNDGLHVGLDSSENAFVYNKESTALYFGTSNTERMRIDSSGNLLVGKTSGGNTNTVGFEVQSNGFVGICGDGIRPVQINRKTSDGDIIEFRKDGAAVGSIGNSGTQLTIDSSSNLVLEANSGNSNVITRGNLRPLVDATDDLGISNRRFNDIYATNGTIQTSDINEKQDIEELNEAEARVAVAAKGLLRKFRWKDAVAEKGDEARTHFGIIAQDLQAAFAAEGLDAGDYAMFIHTTWTDEETGEERSRMGVRYSELLAFIIAAI